MSEKRPQSHKRSKSALALSLLHRDRSRVDEKDEDGSSAVGSPSGSPTASHHSFNSLHRHRSKQQTSESGGASEMVGGSSTSKSNAKTATTHLESINTTADTRISIEQSVKIFRLFEVLRSRDHVAIDQAIRQNTTDSSGQLEGTTILHLAVQCAEPSVIEEILKDATATGDAHVDVNTQDRDGNTPLHLASHLGRVNVVRLLLAQENVNSTIINYQGRSPIDLARNPDIFQQLQLARALLAESKVQTIHRLVTSADYISLEKLLEDSSVQAVLDINGRELATDLNTIETGGTLLHEAARRKDVQLIQLLLLHGADPFCRDKKGRLPQDVTKDDRTRAILKKSPAAAAAQRGIQEKAILGNSSSDKPLGGKESREIKGYLKKWTNYTSGYKLRWFVLEDGVLSYYKHQDDAGSACRGAMNMRIAKLTMDAQDKTRFEIQGKSSIKYHLKANHIVEAKRWFWALNNAIQWTKDEAKDEHQRKQHDLEAARQVRLEQRTRGDPIDCGNGIADPTTLLHSGGRLTPATAVGLTSSSTSHLASKASAKAPGSVLGDEASINDSYEPSVAGQDMARIVSAANTATIAADLDDDDDEYGDDTSDREIQTVPKDAFNITAHSANLQLSLLAQVSSALQKQISENPETSVSDSVIIQAVNTYESAVQSLQSMVADLLKIARDRDAYWQYRVDREINLRHLWEDSMTKIAKEQEKLEGRIGESEEKRKRTKRVLREVLDGEGLPENSAFPDFQDEKSLKPENVHVEAPMPRRKSIGIRGMRRKSTIQELAELSDSDSEADEEFFDAVGAGEVEIVNAMPSASPRKPSVSPVAAIFESEKRETRGEELALSFKGYEDPVRKRLKMDADNRPTISLWAILKSMIGKDMTKMTLPVSFNEPTSLLQRVAEDMEYTDLLDTAADRVDPTERMVYVAAFAASEYASTIGRVAKPFNPLLGETYEYARPDKGYRFYIEQVSHHPPIGAAWAESPKWDYYGESAVKSKFYGKSFDINPLGTWFLKLRPESGGEELYTWKKVTSSVIGIITGSPTVDNYGPMEIKNWTTGEICLLDFKPRGWTASSAFQVTGKVLSADGKTRWSLGGRWNDKIYARLTPGFDDSKKIQELDSKATEPGSAQAFLVWQAHARPKGIPFNLTPFVVSLNALPDNLRPILPPTDTRLRPDQRAMEDGEYDFAATEKNRVEEKQRAVRRLREAKGEEFIPRWFTKGTCKTTGESYWISTGQYWKMRDSVAGGGKWENVEDIF